MYCYVCGGEFDGTGTCPEDCLDGDIPFNGKGYKACCGRPVDRECRKTCYSNEGFCSCGRG